MKRTYCGVPLASVRDYAPNGGWQTLDGNVTIVKTFGLEPWEVYRSDESRTDPMMGEYLACGSTLRDAIKRWQEL